MKKIVLILCISLISVMSGCNHFSKTKISEEQAKSIVLKKHTNKLGKVVIKSVSHKDNEYIVKWGNKENCENGTDYIDDENGKLIKGEASIC
ncbi:hypothetical protein HPT25_03785 [Bacillus sp. BRMEA1]|uniref:hypothetical protein n=1 Tax=Neobacillus endophyticus TaxID=2738405 RepID=UPI001567C4C5|nr:hypothetical protein [Neobacillus endophyticus]NRD76611.1 hypothetical protein [Neobacillus endophyticus]